MDEKTMGEKTRKQGAQTEQTTREWEEGQTDLPETNARLAAATAATLLRPARSENQRLAQENEHLLRQNLPGRQLPGRQLLGRQLPGQRCEPSMTIPEWEEGIEKQPSLLRLLRDRLRPNKSGRER